jgi:hypothetical protein
MDLAFFVIEFVLVLAFIFSISFIIGYNKGEDQPADYNKNTISYYLYFIPRGLGNKYKVNRMFNK